MSQLIQLTYLSAAILFILGLKRLTSPDTARRGNLFSALAMLLAVAATLLHQNILDYKTIVLGLLAGTVIGGSLARFVKMTAMPQLVAVFNGFGGGASALVAIAEMQRLAHHFAKPSSTTLLITMISIAIGSITFTGSMIAFAKLQGLMRGKNLHLPLHKFINILILSICLLSASYLCIAGYNSNYFYISLTAALLLGILFVMPIGGADMPVVVSLLNSLSGLAASAAGFAVNNNILIIAGALVGAAGLILTNIMCKAMNRKLSNVLFASLSTKSSLQTSSNTDKTTRTTDPETAAMLLAYAQSAIIVPGYGMAVAQAQHAVRELADLMEKRGVQVKYAIHPVAGRMPGHMNVLLAEADVPYPQLYDMDEINPEFARTDVALVIGANDVVNPAAKDDQNSPLYGMPILNVDHAKNCIIIKRSMSPGFSGVDNELFYKEKTLMLFGHAKEAVAAIINEAKQL